MEVSYPLRAERLCWYYLLRRKETVDGYGWLEDFENWFCLSLRGPVRIRTGTSKKRRGRHGLVAVNIYLQRITEVVWTKHRNYKLRMYRENNDIKIRTKKVFWS